VIGGPKVHTIHLPGDGSDNNVATRVQGTHISNFYGTKLEGVTSFSVDGSIDSPVVMATITLRVPVRIVYKDAK
jgi:hypothetical protein